MDEDRVELVRSLNAAITEKAEALVEQAVAGQALHASSDVYMAIARDLAESARAIAVLAQAGAILSTEDDHDARG
jgi:hypothetical protein